MIFTPTYDFSDASKDHKLGTSPYSAASCSTLSQNSAELDDAAYSIVNLIPCMQDEESNKGALEELYEAPADASVRAAAELKDLMEAEDELQNILSENVIFANS